MAHVLVVEDDRDTCRLLQRLLRKGGHEVSCAYNGREALAVLEHHRPDVILSDLMMPVMDGADLLHELRRDASWSPVPVIVVTGADASLLRERAESHRPFRTFLKGAFDVHTLLAAIDEAAGPAGISSSDGSPSPPPPPSSAFP
jgi:CheY-like chemotaxis protein